MATYYEIEAPLFSQLKFKAFLIEYPQYPNRTQVQNEIRLSSRQFEKFRRRVVWFVDLTTRDTLIAHAY